MFLPASYADLPEFGVGHATDIENATGCTVFVAPEGATGAVDVRGGGPATRETDLLKPENMIQKIHSVVLSGGSAFGLEAACGTMEVLASRDIGFHVGPACVPIVCGASLFDLLVGQNTHPDIAMGALATTRALDNCGKDPECGNVGAGTGATVGKMGLPTHAMKSGFGFCGLRLGEIVVIANAAVNAAGNIVGEGGRWLAGHLEQTGQIIDPLVAASIAQEAAASASVHGGDTGVVTNTTLGAVLTNAKLTKAEATKVAQITQDAYARRIKPVHTLNDGDTIFVMASGKHPCATDVVAIMATAAMECAIQRAVCSATGAYGLKAASDIGTCTFEPLTPPEAGI